MQVPPDTGFDFLLALIWVVWSVVIVVVSHRRKSALSGWRGLLTIAVSLLVGLALLTFSLERWGFLGIILGWDHRIFVRGLPAIVIELLGLLLVLRALNIAILQK